MQAFNGDKTTDLPKDGTGPKDKGELEGEHQPKNRPLKSDSSPKNMRG